MSNSEQPREPQKAPLSDGPKAPLPAKQDMQNMHPSRVPPLMIKIPERYMTRIEKVDNIGNICLKHKADHSPRVFTLNPIAAISHQRKSSVLVIALRGISTWPPSVSPAACGCQHVWATWPSGNLTSQSQFLMGKIWNNHLEMPVVSLSQVALAIEPISQFQCLSRNFSGAVGFLSQLATKSLHVLRNCSYLH